MSTPTIIRSKPGVKRDGTQFDGDFYTDARWCRFQRGLPRKIGGYRSTSSQLFGKVYGMSSFSANANNYLHLGEAARLEQVVIGNSSGVATAINNRTPAGFASDANNLWQFANLPSAVAGATDLIAHAAPNLADIASEVSRPIYYGQADLATALVATGLDNVSGGATVVGPYVFGYGSGGTVVWSEPNDPTTQANAARVAGQKIVYGKSMRGGGGGPAIILWSLDTVLRGTFQADATTEFAFDDLATEMSLLSSQGIVEYNGIFYWWDASGPQMFNGVVREVPNELNLNFFLDNLNYEHRQKIFGFKVPRFGEIWWCAPMFGATECNWAIILNVRENTWYDTPLPGGFRTSGLYAQVYPKPFMTDAEETETGYTLWQHETGADEIKGAEVEPIISYFETAEISMLTAEEAANTSLRVAIIEPDFVQTGDMTVQVTGRTNARAPERPSEAKNFVENTGDLDAADQIVRFRENRRLMRFKFSTNTPGGDYQMGQCVAHLDTDDQRQTS